MRSRLFQRRQGLFGRPPGLDRVSAASSHQRTICLVSMAVVATCLQVATGKFFFQEQKDNGKRFIISKQISFDRQLPYNDNEAYDNEVDSGIDTALGLEPKFDAAFTNVTVIAGQSALLPCSIEDIGKYKVAWLEHMTSIPLTYEDRRVIDDSRFSVVRSQIKDWNLQIRDTKMEDNGQYRCTINTFPIKSKTVQLNVKVPAQILERLSSRDVTVAEGETLRLVCNATGVPKPQVTWFRKSFSSGHYSSDLERTAPTTRCDLPSTARVPPAIHLANQRIIQWLGRETILECQITAFPQAVNYWAKDGRQVTSSAKHRIEAYDEGDHRLTLSLRIHIQDQTDYGQYLCHASNSLGTDQKSMYLSEPEQKQPAEQLREQLASILTLPHQTQLQTVTEIILKLEDDFRFSSGNFALVKQHASSEYQRKGSADPNGERVSNHSSDVIRRNLRNSRDVFMMLFSLTCSVRLKTF